MHAKIFSKWVLFTTLSCGNSFGIVVGTPQVAYFEHHPLPKSLGLAGLQGLCPGFY
jgi:hypothetical protein